MNRGFLFSVCVLPFLVLATLNSAGYRYGASDQAFYLPAILKKLDPAIYPRDSALIGSQARLTLIDETVAAVARVTGLSLPSLFAALFIASLALLVWAALSLGAGLFRTQAAALAFVFALTLRHQITKTGTNTLEGYFHPRQLAFALGALAIAAYLRRGFGIAPLFLCAGAMVVHPTTALWFLTWIGVAMFVSETRLRPWLGIAAVAASAIGVWALLAGPLDGRLVRMDDEWRATLSSKDYLFPLTWPLSAWLVNLAYAPLIAWIYTRRKSTGLLRPRETGLVLGCLSLLLVFATALILHAFGIALAFQLQPARIFWMLDFLASAYLIWLIAEDGSTNSRRAATAAGIIIALAVARGSYVAYVRFPERAFVQLDVRDDDWGRVMAWARSTGKSTHWLADPFHAALYGTSVRVAGERDVFVEEIKDAAIGMYERAVAIRTRDRMAALGDFNSLTPAHARDLGARFGVDYLVSPQPLDLPVEFRSGDLRVYRLR